ncbi:DUF2637 domain-containing protein [Populibacterium corticicola]|uniref:DUF2637 domain-containing protein n=1 Tax=Populibacterium corticicola TaxID=1812826 RepID=A0ABW5XGY1_9MICO
MGETSARRIRAGATLATVAVAIAAAVLSWSGLTHLAVSVSVSSRIAWLFPVAVDGAMLAGSLTALQAALRGHRVVFPWLVVVFGAALSVYGNIRSVPEGGVDSAIVHGAAPLLLLASLELLFGLIRKKNFETKQVGVVGQAAVAGVQVPKAESVLKGSVDSTPKVSVPDTSATVETARPASAGKAKSADIAKPKTTDTDQEREVLKARVIELRSQESPLSYGKISEELQIPLSTVKRWARQAA